MFCAMLKGGSLLLLFQDEHNGTCKGQKHYMPLTFFSTHARSFLIRG